MRFFNDGWDIYGFPKDHVHGDADDFSGRSKRGKYDTVPPYVAPEGPFASKINVLSDEQFITDPDSVWYYYNAVEVTDWGITIAQHVPFFGGRVRVYVQDDPPTDLSGPYTFFGPGLFSDLIHAKTLFVHIKADAFVTTGYDLVVVNGAPLDDSTSWSIPVAPCVGIPRLRAAIKLATSPRAFPPVPILDFEIALQLACEVTTTPQLIAGIQLAMLVTVAVPPSLVVGLELATALDVPPFVAPSLVVGLELATALEVPAFVPPSLEDVGLELATGLDVPAFVPPSLEDVGLELAATLDVPGPTIYAHDTFTDADGTSIAVHVMDVGSGWTLVTGESASTVGNLYSAGSLDGQGLCYTDVGHTDYTIEADIFIRPVPQNNYYGFYVRYDYNIGSGVKSGYQIAIYEQGDDIAIYEIPSFTLRANASVTINVSTAYHLKAVVSGANIDVYLDGVLKCSYNAATTNSGSTKVALKGPSDAIMDNFLVTS